MTDKPTPKEIDDLVYELRQAGKDDTYSLVSAVLAKWGQREPLMDEQIAEMMRDTWGCASIAPRHAPEFARTVERAHGITQKRSKDAE